MRIGLPMSPSKTQWFINKTYVEYLNAAGFEPIALFPENDVAASLSICDGLLLPGGIDIDPIHYGEDNDYSMAVDPEKDEFERGLFHSFREHGKPIFGICRGFQLIAREYIATFTEPAITAGMYFVQNIGQHNQVNNQTLARNIHQHWVRYIPAGLYGTRDRNVSDAPVNSMHHQYLEINMGETKVSTFGNFHMVAWTTRGITYDKKAPNRVVCEALRVTKWNAPILAVQWHPEELSDYDLIVNFFNKANKSANKPLFVS